MLSKIAFGRNVDAELGDAGDLVQRAEIGPGGRQCAEARRFRSLTALLDGQFAANPAGEPGFMADDRQLKKSRLPILTAST